MEWLGWLVEHYRNNWVDPGTVVVAGFYAVWKHRKWTPPKKYVSRQTGRDLLDGTAIFPLILLTVSVFSATVTRQLLEANKVILFAAGAVALFAVLETGSE